MTRPEPVEVCRPRRDRSFDTQLSEVRQMLARARPDQIRRLMDDIRTCAPSDAPRGTA